MDFSFDDGRNGRAFPPLRKEGWTYFVQVIAPDGPIKIGKANNVGDRFRSLQGGNHVGLRFLGALPYDEIPERDLHRIFRAHHLRGEWFSATDAMLGLADLGDAHFAERYKSPRGRNAPAVRNIMQLIAAGVATCGDDLMASLRAHG